MIFLIANCSFFFVFVVEFLLLFCCFCFLTMMTSVYLNHELIILGFWQFHSAMKATKKGLEILAQSRHLFLSWYWHQLNTAKHTKCVRVSTLLFYSRPLRTPSIYFFSFYAGGTQDRTLVYALLFYVNYIILITFQIKYKQFYNFIKRTNDNRVINLKELFLLTDTVINKKDRERLRNSLNRRSPYLSNRRQKDDWSARYSLLWRITSIL